ncbi:MAG: TlpA family protein disulfide reductase [Bacteroidetes bacterium]|nr:TlpA family protein disulfide reductase [Bacteroidota bacterium]
MKKYFSLLLLGSCILILSCGNEKKPSPLKEGGWKGVLTLNDSTGLVLPFRFDFSFQNDSAQITIHNAEEKIVVNEILFDKDSVFIRMPVFDSEFRCKLFKDSAMTGNWINHSRKEKNIIPFAATFGDSDVYGCPQFDKNYPYEGKWKCKFSPYYPDSSYAVGIFKTSSHRAEGTFLTETGDYRYLEGCVFGKYMLLYCFDGSHAFVFHAETIDDTIYGDFYSGIHHRETWIAWKDAEFKLRNADSLTFMKQGFSKVDFTFPSIENKKVSLSDEKYKNKAVILQIMGSWCPNCMDETMFLSELHKKYSSQGLEVIALAFEKAFDGSAALTTSFEKAKSNVGRLKKKYNSDYDFLITGFQPKDADKALPMLNHVMSFPTTIFIDKKGNVRKIHTGYSGPATGSEYEKFTKETDEFVLSLLSEK